jgi:hypothetical protein
MGEEWEGGREGLGAIGAPLLRTGTTELSIPATPPSTACTAGWKSEREEKVGDSGITRELSSFPSREGRMWAFGVRGARFGNQPNPCGQHEKEAW